MFVIESRKLLMRGTNHFGAILGLYRGTVAKAAASKRGKYAEHARLLSQALRERRNKEGLNRRIYLTLREGGSTILFDSETFLIKSYQQISWQTL